MKERDKVKVNIASTARFHLLDLARELDMNGYDVKFYSYVPNWRTRDFGLPKRCDTFVWIWIAPIIILLRLLGTRATAKFRDLCCRAIDRIVSMYMRRCDVLIAGAGDYIVAHDLAQKRGAVTICDAGAMHIKELNKIKKNAGIAFRPYDEQRNIRSNLIAHYIAVPSEHVKESFLLHGCSAEKMFVNPYGTDLESFFPYLMRKRIMTLLWLDNGVSVRAVML